MSEDDMFSKFLRTESVFKNQQSLNQAWVPNNKEKLLCRDAELKKLIAIHRPIIDTNGEFSTNTLVLGNGGIGKTVSIRYFGRRFREAALKEGVEFEAEYYDCLQHRSKSSILRHLSEKLHYLGGHGYSDNEIMGQILKKLKKLNRSLLIILDEVHNLSSDDILALLNSSIGFGEKNTRFCIICITRPTDWYKVDNEKISSRIQETVRMEPYIHEEAFKILKYRRSLAFRDSIVEDDVVELIAEMVAETKNMRVGIDVLRSCGIRSDEKGLSSIDIDMILESRSIISPTFRADVIDRLKFQEQLALWAIARTLKTSGQPYTKVEEAFENYQLLCEEMEVKAHVPMSFRKYIRNLADVKAIQKDYINPTTEKKGRKLELRLIDISAKKLDEYFTKRIPKQTE